jgi:hypothetical protein
MNFPKNKPGESFFRLAHVLLLAVMLSACGSSAAGTPVITAEKTSASIAGPLRPDPPAIFQSEILNPNDTPRAYIQGTCKYLRARWNPNNAEPGTVVMIIMMRAVRGGPVDNPGDIEDSELKRVMMQLKEQGFEAINTEQLLAFMERNVKIPPRSVMIVRDGSYDKKDYLSSFSQYWTHWKWPIVNGWMSSENISPELWLENIQMENEGFVDHQAGGVQVDTYLTEDSSKVIIARELQGSLDAFAQHFSKTPVAFIWSQGGFGQRAVEIARQIGYQLGFTLNSRGPVMYNWVPLADQADPQRPSYIPEGAIKDPLMTLPRYSPDQAFASIDTVRIIGNNARTYAQANKAAELEYYKTVCEPEYGPIPTPSK